MSKLVLIASFNSHGRVGNREIRDSSLDNEATVIEK